MWFGVKDIILNYVLWAVSVVDCTFLWVWISATRNEAVSQGERLHTTQYRRRNPRKTEDKPTILNGQCSKVVRRLHNNRYIRSENLKNVKFLIKRNSISSRDTRTFPAITWTNRAAYQKSSRGKVMKLIIEIIETYKIIVNYHYKDCEYL